MNRILRTLCAYLCIFSVTANAAGPTIWGPDSRALNLTTQGYTLQSGVTLDNDGITNFVKASTAETSTQPAAWSTYADAAQTTPVDCTGGSANITWTRNTTTPLRGAADFKLTKDAANRQGQGVAYAFTTGPSDGAGELLTITMPVKATEDAAYATGDIGVYVYNVTGAALITPTIVNVEDSAYQFTAQFNLASSSSYRLCFHVASTNASAYDVYFDDITVGLQKYDWPGQINLSNSPIDATGWVASGSGVTVATTTTSTDLPLGSPYASSAIKITPVSGTSDYARSRVTVPAALASTMLKAEWYQRPLSGYASGDLKFDVYSNSASDCSGSFTRIALSTDSSSVTSIPNATGKYTTTFLTDGTSVCYEVRFTRVAGTTALNITNFVFGPGIQPQGAVVDGPYSWTPTFTGLGTPTIAEAKWTRIGTKMFGYVRGTSGTATSDTLTMTLPNSLTAQITTSGIVGTGWRDNATASTRKRMVLRAASASNVITFSNDDYTWDVSPISSSQSGSNLVGNSTVFTLNFAVEIAAWQGSGTVNLANNTPEFAYNSSGITTAGATDTTAFAYGPAGAAIGSIASTTAGSDTTMRVRFQTPIQSTDYIILQTDAGSGGAYWFEASSTFIGYVFQSTSRYGVRLIQVNSTDVDVSFGNKGSSPQNASYAGDGGTWATISTWRWRCVKASSSSAVGFGLATSTSAGLMANPSSLGDAAATMLGYKTYVHGTAYNGGVAPNITLTGGGGSLSSIVRSAFIPYRTQEGAWRLKISFVALVSSASRTAATFGINGVTFKNVSSWNQPLLGQNYDGSVGTLYAFASTNTSNVQVNHTSATTTAYGFSGDVELESKPTWAY